MAAEPVSSAATGGALWKALGLGSALVGSGVVGALLIASFDPPKTKKGLFAQAAVAGIVSLVFGPLAVRTADHYFDFITITGAEALDALQQAAPIYFIVGAMSWGLCGAAVKLRQWIHDKGATIITNRTGIS